MEYEKDQARLQQLWNEMLSDEDEHEDQNDSEDLFGDVYLSDSYKASSSDISSSDEENVQIPKKRPKRTYKKQTNGKKCLFPSLCLL